MSEADQRFSAALCDSLRAEGLQVTPRTDLVRGDSDTRLIVKATGAQREVHVLGPLDDLPLPPRWHAVRIEAGRRSVWEGPSRQSSQRQVQTFIRQLACDEDERLARHWRCLG